MFKRAAPELCLATWNCAPKPVQNLTTGIITVFGCVIGRSRMLRATTKHMAFGIPVRQGLRRLRWCKRRRKGALKVFRCWGGMVFVCRKVRYGDLIGLMSLFKVNRIKITVSLKFKVVISYFPLWLPWCVIIVFANDSFVLPFILCMINKLRLTCVLNNESVWSQPDSFKAS